MKKPFTPRVRKRTPSVGELVPVSEATSCTCGHALGQHDRNLESACGDYDCACPKFHRVIWCRCGHEEHRHRTLGVCESCGTTNGEFRCSQFAIATWQLRSCNTPPGYSAHTVTASIDMAGTGAAPEMACARCTHTHASHLKGGACRIVLVQMGRTDDTTDTKPCTCPEFVPPYRVHTALPTPRLPASPLRQDQKMPPPIVSAWSSSENLTPTEIIQQFTTALTKKETL